MEEIQTLAVLEPRSSAAGGFCPGLLPTPGVMLLWDPAPSAEKQVMGCVWAPYSCQAWLCAINCWEVSWAVWVLVGLALSLGLRAGPISLARELGLGSGSR